MAIWMKEATLAQLNECYTGHLGANMGIEITALHDEEIVGRMPVDHRTKQPFGLLHGGASCVLAESLGSIAAYLCLADAREQAVGVSLTANHLRSVSDGYVIGRARPVRIGKKIQVWDIELSNEKNQLVCKVQFTAMAVRRAETVEPD